MAVVVDDGARPPTYAHADDAGADLSTTVDVEVPPLGRVLVPTGVSVALPAGHVGLVCPRSGLAARHGLTVLNAPGVVDAGYRGEVRVALHNTDRDEAVRLAAGDRVAQLLVVPVARARFVPVGTLPVTGRAGGGFGSTGRGAAGRRTEEEG